MVDRSRLSCEMSDLMREVRFEVSTKECARYSRKFCEEIMSESRCEWMYGFSFNSRISVSRISMMLLLSPKIESSLM